IKCSIGERLQRIEAGLHSRAAPIARIRLVEPMDSLSAAWQRVLDRLPCEKIDGAAAAEGSSTLARLQHGLLRMLAGQPAQSIAWADDGSVQFVRGETRLLAGRWLANRLTTGKGAQLVVAESHGEILDHLLESTGASRHGFTAASAFRPSLQVLPLALALLWEPLDIYAALEFLTHPVCPIPSVARQRFAARLSDRPGLERADYLRVIEGISEHYGERADDVIERIDTWLFQGRHSESGGAPLDAVISRVNALRLVFASRTGTADDASRSAFIAAHHQCESALHGLRQLLLDGQTHIGPIQLRKLVAQATATGSRNPARFAQLGCAAFAEAAGAVIDPFDRIMWWQLCPSGTLRSSPWTRAETRQLAKAGVRLQTMATQLTAATQAAVRPILAARQQLTLVLAPQAEEVHPVWQLIRQLLPNAPVTELESGLTAPDASRQMHKVEHRPLPLPRRWWDLTKPLPTARIERHSFSSLDQYINNPSQWVLGYLARLEGSRIHSIPDEFTMSGNVAHRVVQQLFERDDALTMKDSALRAWLAPTVDAVLRSEAALFLLPGQRAAQQRLRDTIESAVLDLRAQLSSAGVTRVEAERWMEGRFTGGALVGSADLVVTFGTGETGVVDLKWAGVKKYPDKLVQNRHLQLLVYGALLKQTQGSWPRYAYYILRDTRLLAHDREVFAQAQVCTPEERLTLPQLWKRLEQTFKWRQQQLESGRVEVVLDPSAEDDDSAPPADSLSLEYLSKSYNPYLHLTGWGAQS
ncbi:MAG TPA: PD-(D/E)XK nuclease family protein, partial [Gammaproteobacteria bacterium]|nr:PD-(D/E)XK nuclease family protein [Gammaproteobacteria bacterium]